MMNVTQQMIDAMNELLVTLADTLDDDYSDVTADIFEQYELTNDEEEYCRDYYMSKHENFQLVGWQAQWTWYNTRIRYDTLNKENEMSAYMYPLTETHFETRNAGHKTQYHVFYQIINGVRCNVHTSKDAGYLHAITSKYTR